MNCETQMDKEIMTLKYGYDYVMDSMPGSFPIVLYKVRLASACDAQVKCHRN